MKANKSGVAPGAERNPMYVKIGKRIRQARLMARESNSRDLSLRLGWSAGRLHNYETGLSTPGVEETLQFCETLKVDPSWITYGVGAPRADELHSARYRNFIDALDDAERSGYLEEYLAVLKLPIERMLKFRKNPYSKIPDVMARRCEKFFKHQRGWVDQLPSAIDARSHSDDDLQDLLALYAKLSSTNRKRLFAMGQLLLD